MAHSLLSIRELTPLELAPRTQDGEPSGPMKLLNAEFAECKSRPEWCFAAEQSGQIVGLLGYRAPAAHSNLEQTPDTLILFHLYLSWDSSYHEVGRELLEHSFAKLHSLGVAKIKWAFDTAEFWGDAPRLYPHWQKQWELAKRVGMSLRQEKINYLYHVPAAT